MAERVFAMPDLGEGLEGGRIVDWLVSEGEEVSLNQPLVEVETAKAIVDIPSPFAGRIARLHAEAGGDVGVGSPLVTFDVGSAGAQQDRGHPDRASVSEDEERTRPAAPQAARATPPVRRLAKELGVDLASIAGTGPQGRITEEDVRGRMSPTDELVEPSAIRRAIAANLERQAAIPQVTTFRTLDCTALETVRHELEVSPLPVVVAALVDLIREHPLLNAAWGGEHLRLRREVHVGIAADTERGLVVPVLRDAGGAGVAELAARIADLADRARGGSLRPDELTGATIAVSNTGSYGSEAGTPILSPGTSVTLAFGAILPRAAVVDGEVVPRPLATISMTFDHRVLDGAAAGRALSDLVSLLESAHRLGGLPR